MVRFHCGGHAIDKVLALVQVLRQHNAHALVDDGLNWLHLKSLCNLVLRIEVVGVLLPVTRQSRKRLLVAVLEEDGGGQLTQRSLL